MMAALKCGPTAALKTAVGPTLVGHSTEFTIPMLYVTHSIAEVEHRAERVLALDEGRLIVNR
jgi:ABC-type molybdate transport system ATPase subunit